MYICLLLGHSIVNRSPNSSLCSALIKVFGAHPKANGSVSHIVHYHFWSLGESLHLSSYDVACIANGKFYT